MLTQIEIEQLNEKCNLVRKSVLEMLAQIGGGHIGGSMSAVEALVVLYDKVMNIDPQTPRMKGRDWFVLSKGHSGPVLYAVLAHRGYFNKEELLTLNQPGTKLPSHCDMRKTVGIDMTAGSLGQGFSAAVGIALGAKMAAGSEYVFSMVGDGECQEGQIWEAAMLAAHNKLDNFIGFVDNNKMQIDGWLDDIVTLGDLESKWKAFGFNTILVDGHNVSEIYDAIMKAKSAKGKPSMIILDTVKGKGVKFAENKDGCHHMTVSHKQCEMAVAELNLNEGDKNA